MPKVAFGKFIHQEGSVLMPTSVEVHHSLMDGLHVGQYLKRLEEMFRSPEQHIGSA